MRQSIDFIDLSDGAPYAQLEVVGEFMRQDDCARAIGVAMAVVLLVPAEVPGQEDEARVIERDVSWGDQPV